MIKYLGSKRRLVPVLSSIAAAAHPRTALDLFTGTTRVAQAFKRAGAHVTAVDSARYAHVFAQCYVATDAADVDQPSLIDEIRRLDALPGQAGYVTETFCRRARFFQPHNGERIRKPMKLLVVGGAGYVGSALIPALLERGYEVDVIDLRWFGVHLPEEVSVVDKDILSCTPEDLEGYEQVIFLAGLSNDPMAEFDPAMNFVANAAVPSYLAYLAKLAGVRRVIYASSCSVYGYTVNELYDEDSPATSSYPYGISKLQGEQGVLQMRDDRFSAISLRKGTICGYSPRMRFDLIVNTMYMCCLRDGEIRVDNPSLWRPILDMRDAVSGYLRAIQADYSISGVFNIASDNYTVGQVGDKVKHQMEKLLGRRIGLDIKQIPDLRNYKVTIEKARTVLGFEPSHDVTAMIEDLHAHRDLYGDLEADQYYNIRVFRKMAASSQSS